MKKKRQSAIFENAPTPEEWDGIRNQIYPSLLPLLSFKKNKVPTNVGTGFLVRSGSSHYLVTAAHVFHDTVGSGLPLWFLTGGGKFRAVTEGYRTTSVPKDRNRDRLDVGVVKLTETPLPPYGVFGTESLSMTLLAPGRLPRNSWRYLAAGFPSSQSEVNRVAGRYTSPLCIPTSESAPSTTYSALGVNPETNIIIPYDVYSAFDEQLNPVQQMPDPHGMSGGAMWIIDENLRTGTKTAKVVGVLTEYLKSEEVMIATDIDVALVLIGGFEGRCGG